MQDQIKKILDKGKLKDANKQDKQEMFALFHQAENEYKLKDHLLKELENTEISETPSPNFKNLFTKLWSKIEKKGSELKSNKRFIYTLGKIAAAVVIGLFLGFYVSSVKTNNKPIYYAAHSPKGSVSEMILPDSSIIFLNADSKIKYSYNGEKGIREVFLEGEAWFDVHKNKKKPFIVHTPFYDISVTGTQFNVKAYESDSEITTTLEEGEVIINSTEKFRLAKNVTLVPGEQLILDNVTLVPGEQLILDKEAQNVTINTVNTNWFTSWKDNKLIIVNMSLNELIILLERKYGVDIEVKNDAIHDLHFDFILKNETIIEILEIIKKTLPIDYKIVGQKIEITAK